MKLVASQYKFTSKDTAAIKAIGYKFVGAGSGKLEKFLQTNFPNLNLLQLLESVELVFTPTTSLQIHRAIEFDTNASTLKIDYYNDYQNPNMDDAALFKREFLAVNQGIQVTHELCVLPKSFRNQKLIKTVFRESLQQYVNIKAKVILVHAGLSGGGYTWAKYGFVATVKKEVDDILTKAKPMLSRADFAAVEKIHTIYYTRNPSGKSFPIELWAALDCMKKVLMGSTWQGEVDLKNPQQFRNFSDYVFR